MFSGEVAVITPQALTTAVRELLADYPDDGIVIDRLFAYLDRTQPKLAEIRAAVCEFYAISPQELLGTRKVEYVMARHIFCYLAHRYTRSSMPKIARTLGGQDHTTVRHAVLRIERYLITRPLVADDISVLCLRISEKMLRRPNKGTAS